MICSVTNFKPLNNVFNFKDISLLLNTQQKRILIIAVATFGFLGTCYTLYRYILKDYIFKKADQSKDKEDFVKIEDVANHSQIDKRIEGEVSKVGVVVNDPKISLKTLGCKTAGEAIDYIIDKQLLTANLLEFLDLTDEDVKKLSLFSPNLKHLSISSNKISNEALAHLKGMSLTSVEFSFCYNLTDQALAHLEGMPLTSVNFSCCKKLTDQALAHLKGMPLTNINFSLCYNLTDQALAHLEGMPLTSVNFSYCKKLTNQALVLLKGMPLTNINFSNCYNLTDQALAHLEGVSLTSVEFSGCFQLTNEALTHLEGMPLTSINFSLCNNLTDQALVHLQGMPLTNINLSFCKNLTNQALVHLKGMPLTSVNFSYYALTPKALAALKQGA